jgi:uncharacterized membrane protein
VAGQFEQRHLARVEVLERKLAAQESELALAEREVEEMTAQLRSMAAGVGPTAAPAPELDAEPDLDALERAAQRAARESAAERQLEELKRRMGR